MKYQDCNDVLPEDCISTILSFTTPQDTCRSSSVSSLFHLAADSDVVWDKFLPSNYQYIVSQSVSPIVFSSKRDLFFLLQNPTFIDHGNKMLALERSTGKITCMLSAKELSIAGSNDPMEWIWTSSPESRFSDVAELRSTTRLEIKGKIRSNTLSPKTNYAAYLVMKLTDCSYGLDSLPSEVSIEVRNSVSKGRAYLRRNDSKKQWLEQVYYSNRVQMLRSRVSEGEERIAKERNDGWMEIELGEFYNGNDMGDCEIKMSLMEVKGDQLKGGLVIEGIELRPKSK